MPRRPRYSRHEVPTDSKYNSRWVQIFINKVMWKGKKSLSERIVYEAMEIMAQRAKRDALELFEQAIRNASPVIEVRPRRVGGATYQVPVEVTSHRRTSLAMRWILNAARSRSGRPIAERLAIELLDAANNTGVAVKRREDTHRMAEANKAFAHYRW
ncbi:MAG: 30S ribosomal protein S7 [Chloroflexia bacterium]|nr:30S ribosomal protein S7 [Chloroflexia bacterium]